MARGRGPAEIQSRGSLKCKSSGAEVIDGIRTAALTVGFKEGCQTVSERVGSHITLHSRFERYLSRAQERKAHGGLAGDSRAEFNYRSPMASNIPNARFADSIRRPFVVQAGAVSPVTRPLRDAPSAARIAARKVVRGFTKSRLGRCCSSDGGN